MWMPDGRARRCVMPDWGRLAWACLACGLLLVTGGAGGYLAAHVHDAQRMATAQSDTAVCKSAAKTQQAVIDQMTRTQQTNQQTLDAARAVAAAAMRARDALQHKLATQARQHQRVIEEAAHVHAACASLVDWPVCPAVAHRLFDPGHGDHAAAGDHRGS